MNERIKELMIQSGMVSEVVDNPNGVWTTKMSVKTAEKFAELIIEETLSQVDEKCYGRGENQWYYEDDKQWIRLHFGYGEIK